jgi:Cu(I)/Ag(I) efflux system membrane protein CusA/SilA
MTVITIIVGLFPIMWSTGAGADVMKRIAAPLVGGSVTSLALEMLVYPVIYFVWRGRGLAKSMLPTAPALTLSENEEAVAAPHNQT